MNIKKFISVAGYTMLQPVSFLCKMQKSKMTTEEAHRILASVYAIDKDDLDFIGGGVNVRLAYYLIVWMLASLYQSIIANASWSVA